MLLAGGIFFKLIHYSTLYSGDGGSGFDTILGFFLGNGLNLLLLVAAACLYGFTKEVNDLTTLSYILNTSDPSEYGTVISRNNIFTGAGALLGLVASGFILTLSPTIAIIVLNVCIVMLLVFIFSYFDSGEKTITIADVMKLKVIAERENLEKMKEYAI